MALETRADGTLTYVTGSMGSGKTTWVKQRVARARRLLVWDGKGIDWGPDDGCEVVTSLEALRKRLFEPQHRLSVRVRVSRGNFGAFCILAWIWARYKPSVLVIDEIADVTTPAKAPLEWGEIARKSRAFGTDVYVTTQRPQEADKTAQGNAMVFHCGLMSDEDDRRYVARRLLGGVDPARVAALGPLEYIERDVRTREIRTGRVDPSKRAVPPRVKPAPPPVSELVQPATPPRTGGFFDW